MTKEARIQLLSDLDQSTALAAGILFPDIFSRPFDPLHKAIFDIIDRRPGDVIKREEVEYQTQPVAYRPRKGLIAPRGVGKTSIVELVAILAIILQRTDYIIVIGHNATDAEEKTENIKTALVENPIIAALYGDIKGDVWSKEEWVVQIGGKKIKVQPRGSGQPVRGRSFVQSTPAGILRSRPGLVLVDDLEKAEETETEEQRKKKKTWFYSDVLNAIDRGKKFRIDQPPPWEIIVVGTILHHDSFLLNLHKSKNWDTTKLEICDDSFVSNAPNFMSDEECREAYQQFKDDNELDVWFREYRNNPVPIGEDAAFQPRYFKYYSEQEEELNRNPHVETVVIVDPSRTANPSSAPTGIVAVGLNMGENKIYVRRCVDRKMHIEEMYDEIARTITLTDARVLAVEVTGLHEFITHPLKTFLSKRGISIEFIELHARKGVDEKGKVARVRSLVDFYREGIIWHNVDGGTCIVLENQLQQFPSSSNWSVMDPFGYITELLEKGERYLSFLDASDLESPEDIEREFKELEKMYEDEEEEYEGADWRPSYGF